MVAYHSCAVFEASERGLSEDLIRDFDDEQSSVTDALWYSDMTTGPDGQDLDGLARLSEVRERYGPDDVVTRFWARAEPVLMAAVQRAQDRIAG